MDYRHRPSGEKLPLFLLKKWRKRNQGADVSSASSIAGDTNSQSLKASCGSQADRLFSIGEIENRLRKTAAAVSNLQKQIYRGEELYYEDTMPHRNICKGGLEGFVDTKDVVSGDSGLTRGLHQSIRKVPGDVRWFSESSVSKEEMHKRSLDIVHTASAKKPMIDASDGDLNSSDRKHSQNTIHLNDVNSNPSRTTKVNVESIDTKRKRNDTDEHGHKIPPARRSKTVELKNAQSNVAAKMNEDYSDGNSELVLPKDIDSEKTSDPHSRKGSTTALVKKDESKKVDSQRRRRSRRGANS
ncbi:unnamed protein product [Cylindrotheca closterium]|uniref:Chromatin modification-related protein MEAF6 n=1 Tax=Cylindrotheca closterium TaxID=2856 RepID=A0AAD2CTV0_9STRA|nr:unnamed protein product [Cylindrotheca closterium]